jgi:hypothetical protein
MEMSSLNTLTRSSWETEAESKEKHGVWGRYAGVDYNFTLCRLQSRLW